MRRSATRKRRDMSHRVWAPALALAERLVRGRWWHESELSTNQQVTVVAPNVADRQTVNDGVGDVLTRRYEIDLSSCAASPQEIFQRFREQPDQFAPTDYATFGPGPLREGDRFDIRLAGPWNGPVEVLESSRSLIRLVTLDGHMEAGRITFSVIDQDETQVFRIESTAAAGDRAFWLLYELLPFGRWVQTDMWSRVLESAVKVGGSPTVPKVDVVTVQRS